MKRNLFNFAICVAALASVLGCGMRGSAKKASNIKTTANANTANANEGSLANKAINAAVGESKLGVPECDELFDALAVQTQSPDDSIVTRTAKQVFLNKLREDLKKSTEENRNDKVKMATQCKDFKTQLDAYSGNTNSNM
jgi:hypothetical protein